MPGRRLSNSEQALQTKWDAAGDDDLPTLRTIEIAGGSGLRGIDGLIVHFRYPITAICGTNGVGKSTVLALAALAFRPPHAWAVHRGHGQAQPKSARSHYLFSDFFVQGHGDAPIDGVEITWRYRRNGQESSKKVKKLPQRWGKYAGQPERAVHFLPLGRLTPAYEVGAMRSIFAGPPAVDPEALSEDSRADLSYIMGRQYGNAGVQRQRRWRLQRCETNAPYTAFNMGGGESCMISLLHLLQELPDGGMLVIEEIEAGLHPQAQIRLAERLVDACLRRDIQVVCTTHSPAFLDALPRQARLLLKRQATEHVPFESPTTRFAMAEMTGQLHPELLVYCEDATAAVLVSEALAPALRPRVAIREIGSKTTVIRQGVAHRRAELDGACLCVLDGDCTDVEVGRWLRRERNEDEHHDPPWLILPGQGSNPERWAIEQLRLAPYDAQLAQRLGTSVHEARAHVEAASVDIDAHDLGYTLAQRTGLDRRDALRRAMQAFCFQHPQLDALRNKVTEILA